MDVARWEISFVTVVCEGFESFQDRFCVSSLTTRLHAARQFNSASFMGSGHQARCRADEASTGQGISSVWEGRLPHRSAGWHPGLHSRVHNRHCCCWLCAKVCCGENTGGLPCQFAKLQVRSQDAS